MLDALPISTVSLLHGLPRHSSLLMLIEEVFLSQMEPIPVREDAA